MSPNTPAPIATMSMSTLNSNSFHFGAGQTELGSFCFLALHIKGVDRIKLKPACVPLFAGNPNAGSHIPTWSCDDGTPANW